MLNVGVHVAANAADSEPEMLQSVLGGGELVCLSAPIADKRSDLTVAEMQNVMRAVSKRQFEFATGRWLARRALIALGYPATEVLARSDRQPQWPAVVVGSITHSAGFAAVAVAPCTAYAGVGIDLEQIGRVGDELLPRLLTPKEIARYHPGRDQQDIDATLIFSAKEACYKLLFPLFGAFIGFHEVEIEIEPGSLGRAGLYRAHYLGEDRRHAVLGEATGCYLRMGERWLTCITLEREQHC